MRREILHAELSNGLHLIGEPCDAAQSAALGFFVKTGARDETQKEAGVSHFLEHMMFKGTPTRSALDITYAMGKMGAQANAFTSEESTVFYTAIIPEYFGNIQELFSDMLRPALTKDDFDMEKKVILEEIALYQDRPEFYLFEHALQEHFAGHPAGNSVLGSTESVSAISQEEMLAYFSRRYTPSNLILVASGKYDWKAFVADATKYCDKWSDAKALRKTEPYRGRELKKTFNKKDLNQAHAVFIADGASAQSEHRFAMSLLSVILGDGSGSKMYWELVATGLAESASVDNDERDGTGIFVVYLGTEPERLEQCEDIARRILTQPLNFSDDELDRAKTKLMSRLVFSGELPMGRLMALGNMWSYLAKTESLDETIEHVRKITRKDIENAIAEYPLRVWSEFRLLP